MFAFTGKTAQDPRIDPGNAATGFALVEAAEAWGFHRADAKSARVTQFTHGEALGVHRENGAFRFVQSRADLYCAWVEAKCLRVVDQPPRRLPWVSRCIAPLTGKPDMKSPLIACLPPDARFAVARRVGEYCQIAGQGWVHRAHIEAAKTRRETIDTAREQIGRSYVWGGRGIAGIDCSALVQLCYRFAGRALPRDADLQRLLMRQRHHRVGAGEEKRGDLIFIPGHVMLVIAPGKVIHASAWHMRVVEEPLAAVLQRREDTLGVTFFRESYRWRE